MIALKRNKKPKTVGDGDAVRRLADHLDASAQGLLAVILQQMGAPAVERALVQLVSAGDWDRLKNCATSVATLATISPIRRCGDTSIGIQLSPA